MLIRCLLALACICGPLLAGALAAMPAATPERWLQLTTPDFQHLGRADGLPNGSVSSLTQDAEGFLWAGTHGGLVRWDGHRFRVFRSSRFVPGALPDGLVQALHTDSQGRVWVGTGSAGLWRFDAATERFEPLPGGAAALSDPQVRAIADDGAGGLWVGTEGGLDHVDAQGHVRRSVFDGRVTTVLRDRRGRLWVGVDGRLWRAEGGAGARFDPVALRPPTTEQPAGPATGQPRPGPTQRPADPPAERPSALHEDSQGRIWVGTRGNGLFMLADGQPPQRMLEPQRMQAAAAVEPLVSAVAEVRPGEIWVATLGRGIFLLDTGGGPVRRLHHRATQHTSLPSDMVRGMHLDRSGLLWVASDHGLSRVDPTQQALLTLHGARGDDSAGQPALASAEPSALLALPDGRVWVGTHHSGIDVIDPTAERRVAALRPDPTRPEQALPADFVLSMVRAADGTIYIATRRGIYRAPSDASRVERVPTRGRDATAASWVLLADGGQLWIGGEADGLWRLDLASGRAQRVGDRGAPAGQQLGDSRITTLAWARPDAGAGPRGLWVGTRSGLLLLDTRTGTVRRPVAGRAAAGFITHLHHDRQGRLWVGSYGEGLDILSAGADAVAQPLVAHLGERDGLPDDNVNVMLEDERGRVWLSSDNGLVVIDTATLVPQVLRRAEGVSFATYWSGAGARTAAGELLFGGDGGLTIVRPERFGSAQRPPPRVLLGALRVGERLLPSARFGTPGSGPVQVSADGNSLSVEFGSDDFASPERSRHAWRLQGFDADWVEADPGYRRASYTNLPPGHYTLRLRVSDRNGVWSAEERTLPVQVLPAWHQTWAFHALLGVLAFSSVALLLQWRTRVLRQRRDELEAKVRERTAELEAMSLALEHKSRVLEASSLTDPLTGLRNRRQLAEQVDVAVAASLRRAQQQPGHGADTDNLFMLVDADHFKAVNDQHGHAAGDAVLVQFAERLRMATRETDLLVRWGGEEFLVVARDTDRAHAEELAERVRASVAGTPFRLDNGRRLALSCSIGLVAMPLVPGQPQAVAWPEVVELADLALLEAKRTGRNGWVVLQATARTRPEGLVHRAQASLAAVLAAGELRLSSSRPGRGAAGAGAAPGSAPDRSPAD